MNRHFCARLALVALLLANFCQAAVFERDWRVPGDGLLTYDDVNRREWLDLSVSVANQFPEPRLENAVAQLAPGGLFEGFTWGKSGDVIDFADSAGVDTSTTDFSTNELPLRSLIDLLGPIPPFTDMVLHSIGFIDEVCAPPFRPDQVGADFFVDPQSGLDGRAGLTVSSFNDLLATDTVGLMLYRSVPEPSGIWLFGTALIYLIVSRA